MINPSCPNSALTHSTPLFVCFSWLQKPSITRLPTVAAFNVSFDFSLFSLPLLCLLVSSLTPCINGIFNFVYLLNYKVLLSKLLLCLCKIQVTFNFMHITEHKNVIRYNLGFALKLGDKIVCMITNLTSVVLIVNYEFRGHKNNFKKPWSFIWPKVQWGASPTQITLSLFSPIIQLKFKMGFFLLTNYLYQSVKFMLVMLE